MTDHFVVHVGNRVYVSKKNQGENESCLPANVI